MKLLASAGWTVIALSGMNGPALAASPIHVVVIATTPDGGLLIEGRKYATPAAVNAKLAEIDHRQPKPALDLSANDSKDFESQMRAIKIIQAMGVPKIGILIEPKSK